MGRTIKMQCTVLQGNPWPRIMWIKDGELVGKQDRIEDDGNGNLIIRNVQVDDKGEFVCLATNVGGNATYVTKLDVQGGSGCYVDIIALSLFFLGTTVESCPSVIKGLVEIPVCLFLKLYLITFLMIL